MRMRELRAILKQLERQAYLVKGHLLRGSSMMFWATKKAHGLLGKARFSNSFVLSPEDNLYHFLRASSRELVPPGGRHLVFKGVAVVGSFAGRYRKGELEISDVQGGPECMAIVDEYARMLDRRMRPRSQPAVSDWEIVEFYEKSHPGT